MIVDSHCHLTDKRYKKSVSEIIQEAKDVGVDKFITIGTSVKESKMAIELSKEFDCVYPTVGIYPHEEPDQPVTVLNDTLQKLLNSNPEIMAIGECGIDITDREGVRPIKEQIEIFKMQIALSIEKHLPLCIHNRNGEAQLLNILRNYPNARGVIHCFTSNWEFAKKILNLGFYISFSAIITYPSAGDLIETVKKVPFDRFLLETDSPYLPPLKHRGEVNTPANAKIVAQEVSNIKGIALEEICRYSYNNTFRAFDL